MSDEEGDVLSLAEALAELVDAPNEIPEDLLLAGFIQLVRLEDGEIVVRATEAGREFAAEMFRDV